MKNRTLLAASSLLRLPALLAAILLAALPLGACQTYRHTVGEGAKHNRIVASQAQWWFLWGLVPISPGSPVDAGKLLAEHPGVTAGGKTLPTDYEITTGYTTADSFLSVLLFPLLGFGKQTITVRQ